MALLDDVKLGLRLTSDVFDDELTVLIDACLKELSMGGVGKTPEEDPIVRRAAVLYCKAHFGYDDKADRYRDAYEHLRTAMALSSDFAAESTESGDVDAE